MKKVIILTGPGGSGKTTIAKLIEKGCGYVWLDGDHEDSEFFSSDSKQYWPENSDNLRRAHDKILRKTKELFNAGKKVVVDYIIFGHYLEFFDKFKKAFGDDLQISVLFPEVSENVKRDKNRECWTAGVERVSTVHCEFKEIRDKIGKDNYINTSEQTPEETFNKYFKCDTGD